MIVNAEWTLWTNVLPSLVYLNVDRIFEMPAISRKE